MKSLFVLSALCSLSLACLPHVSAYAKGTATVDESGSPRVAYKGKVSRFGYYYSKDPSSADPGGCKIQIDTAPGTVFMVYLDKNADNVIGKQGMCRIAFDSLAMGQEIIIYEDSGAIAEISVSR